MVKSKIEYNANFGEFTTDDFNALTNASEFVDGRTKDPLAVKHLIIESFPRNKPGMTHIKDLDLSRFTDLKTLQLRHVSIGFLDLTPLQDLERVATGSGLHGDGKTKIIDGKMTLEQFRNVKFTKFFPIETLLKLLMNGPDYEKAKHLFENAIRQRSSKLKQKSSKESR
jgi:hypothetical protein